MFGSSWAVAIFVAAALPLVAQAQETQKAADSNQEKSNADNADQSATQRIDFGLDYYESADGNVTRGGINYNWAPLADHSFAATLPYIDAGLGNSDGSGVGDLLLRYNWLPALTLSADPWIPNNLGIGFGLLIPTGDATKGTGGDQWAISPSLGWAAKIGKRTTLLPQLQYTTSFAEGELAKGIQAISLSVDLVHVTPSKFWFQYTPAASYDLDGKQYEFDNLVVVGKQFSRRFALRFELRSLNVTDPHDPTGEDREFDYRATLKLQWILAY